MAGQAYLGADILEVSLGQTSRVAAQLHLRVLITIMFVFALTHPKDKHQHHHHHSYSCFHPLLQRRIIIKTTSNFPSSLPCPISSFFPSFRVLHNSRSQTNRSIKSIQLSLSNRSNMTLPVYHQDLCELFQRADCPSIFSRRSKSQTTLASFPAGPQNIQESLRAVKAVLDAILYLRMNLIMPCQLRFEYIVLQKNRWGLCHAICERAEQIAKQNDDSYNPEEYIFHLDSENQLVWNLGKVWLRFFTDQPIKIKHNTQKKVDRMIDTYVPSADIAQLLKKILVLDKTQRIKFQDLLNQELLGQQQEQQTKFYCSLMCHLKNMSGMMGSKGGMTNFQQKNPYIRELNYRRFMEYLDIDFFLEGVKRDLLQQYGNEDQQQKFNIEFTAYMISLQDYKNMVKLNTERMELGERFQEINDRIYYAKFTKRMLDLRGWLDRRAKVIVKNNPKYIKKSFAKFLEDPDNLDDNSVYLTFKTWLSEYGEYLKQDLQLNSKDIFALKLLAKILIARTSGYIFNQYRTEVFQTIYKNQKVFNIKKLYAKINDCCETDPLRLLIVKIQDFYFKN